SEEDFFGVLTFGSISLHNQLIVSVYHIYSLYDSMKYMSTGKTKIITLSEKSSYLKSPEKKLSPVQPEVKVETNNSTTTITPSPSNDKVEPSIKSDLSKPLNSKTDTKIQNEKGLKPWQKISLSILLS